MAEGEGPSGPSERAFIAQLCGFGLIWFGAHYLVWRWIYRLDVGWSGEPIGMALFTAIFTVPLLFIPALAVAHFIGEGTEGNPKPKVFAYTFAIVVLMMFLGPVLHALFPSLFAGYGVFTP